MTDQRPEELWVELKGPIESCKKCVQNPECTKIKNFITGCTKERYRFRCPIEVLDERTEE